MNAMRKVLLVAAMLAAAASSTTGRAEDVCVDAGAVGPIGVSLPEVCVPVP